MGENHKLHVHTEQVNSKQFLQGLEHRHTAMYRSQSSPDNLDRCFTQNSTIVLQLLFCNMQYPRLTSPEKGNRGMVLQKDRAACGQRAGDTATSACPASGSCTSHCTSLNLFLLPLRFFFSECEQFRAGPLHCCTSNLRWAPQPFAAYMISHSSNNGPAPVTCNTCSSFASCSDTDLSLFLAQRRDCTFVAIQLQYGNYWHGCKHWISFWSHPCLTLTLPSSCVTAPFVRVPFSCHFLCWINQNSPSTTIRHTVH